jgi:hypothetical protein
MAAAPKRLAILFFGTVSLDAGQWNLVLDHPMKTCTEVRRSDHPITR